ncbi:MAG: DEAD/DEAH box helicase family protein [Myxococcota bacterium]|nr:DEAD/DEAH box helicase family protein [Myxococcota bacterium]
MAIVFEDDTRRLVLGVGDLVGLRPQRGHLRMEAVLGSSARMAAGRQAHSEWQRERTQDDPAFHAEVSLSVRRVVRDWECHVRGRLDGLSLVDETWMIEEVKSTMLSSERILAASAGGWLDWEEQARIYAWLAEAGGRTPVGARLVVVSLVDGKRHEFPVDLDVEAVGAEMESRLERLLCKREAWLAWRAVRRSVPVVFPHAQARELQNQVAIDVENGMAQGQQLLLSAPTGTGKTAAVLTGAIRHAYEQGRRVFVATSKGTQREIFERTLQQFAAEGLPIRTVLLRAREKVCLNDVVDCRPEACRFAEGHHDRVDEVVERLLAHGPVSTDRIDEESNDCRVCPFALSMEIADRADVVVGDYNYAFHPRVRLRSLLSESWDEWVLIVDEAHNLVERARDYWSGSLSMGECLGLADWVRAEFGADAEAHAVFCEEVGRFVEDCRVQDDPEAEGEWETSIEPRPLRELEQQLDGLLLAWVVLRAGRRLDPDPFASLAFEVRHFCDLVETSGDESVGIYERSPGEKPVLRLVCLDPSREMRPRIEAFAGSVLMSATLEPAQYHQDLLGLNPERVHRIARPSGWPASHRGVVLATRVSTAWKDREAHRERTGGLICDLLESIPGSVAVYYPSYAMLRSIAPLCEVEGRE